MNLFYECQNPECKKTWKDLNSECPHCGCKDYTVIESSEDSTFIFPWKWVAVITIGVILTVGVFSFVKSGCTLESGWPFVECNEDGFEFKVNDSANSNYFTYDPFKSETGWYKKDDKFVFKSLDSGGILKEEDGRIYPCKDGDIQARNVSAELRNVSASESLKAEVFQTLNFIMNVDIPPHPEACNCECSELLSFKSDRTCDNYFAMAADTACTASLIISFDNKKTWSDKGVKVFSKADVGLDSILYFKFTCMPENQYIERYKFENCSVLNSQDGDEVKDKDGDGDGVKDKDDDCPLKKGLVKFNGCPEPAPNMAELNKFLEEFHDDKVGGKIIEAFNKFFFEEDAKTGIFYYNTDHCVYPSGNVHTFMDLYMHDYPEIRKIDSDFAISFVGYNDDLTRIERVEFNNLK